MGVPKFYRWLSERYPCLSEVVKEHQIPEFDHLYLDMNGVIHTCSHPNDDDPHFRISEEQIFAAIFHYLEVLFRMIQPRKLFFLAVDGVAPRAKMNQQRARRFRSAREAEANERKARDRGEVLPKEARFDSNCITPGTPFMVRLQSQLEYFISNKLSTDSLWQGVQVILSGHETPGEGEHKIMDYIRHQKAQPGYDPNVRHCLYGLDADLVMLGLCTHDPHFSLLREEVRFGGKKTASKRTATPEETTFHLLHLSLLREYIDHEFSDLQHLLPFAYDLEAIIDDWVMLGFLVGNDFIPNLPNLHINKGALTELFDTYKRILPGAGGYINNGGTLNLRRFEMLMRELGKQELERFQEIYSDTKWLEGKAAARNSDGKHTIKDTPGPAAVQDLLLGGAEGGKGEKAKKAAAKDSDLSRLLQSAQEFMSSDEDESAAAEACAAFAAQDGDNGVFQMEFRQYKREYYMQKMNYPQVDAGVLREQAECYVRAIQWVLHYYYNGCQSWSWYYPYHFAPWITDIVNFADLGEIQYEMAKPFLPFEQLLSVLPAASKELLPRTLQSLMIDENSPIIDFYPVDFECDLNGKQQDWEAVVLIPFIDEAKLLEAMKPGLKAMTKEEKARNVHGPMNSYTFSEECLGTYEAPAYFPAVTRNHALCRAIDRLEWKLKISQLKKGLMEGVRLDVFFPGFLTLKHIPHRAYLKAAGVRVFEQASRGENMLLQLEEQGQPLAEDVAKELLQQEIWVSWPHMVEAKVTKVTDASTVYFKDAKGNLQAGSVGADGARDHGRDGFAKTAKTLQERYMSRYGIDIGVTHILVYATPMTGRKYVCGSKGRITLEKQWARHDQPYALQTTRKDILVHDPSFTQYRTLGELFPVGSSCFMLGQPHYGAQGKVLQVSAEHRGRVQLAFRVNADPDISAIIASKDRLSMAYLPAHNCSQQLGLPRHLLPRITGSIFVIKSSKGTDTDRASKVNVGLNLKFSRRNEEVAGYTRRQNETWLYSQKALALVEDYARNFPDLFQFLGRSQGNGGGGGKDCFFVEDVFPREKEPLRRLEEVQKWLKEQPSNDALRQACGTMTLDNNVIQELERTLGTSGDGDEEGESQGEVKEITMQVRPHLLYKPNLVEGHTAPDEKARNHLFDRVVNVREGYSVPLGLKGVITGIHEKTHTSGDKEMLYDILFDKPFPGGIALRSSAGRSYRLPPSAFINLTFGNQGSSASGNGGGNANGNANAGKRSPNQQGGAVKPTAVVLPISAASGQQPPVGRGGGGPSNYPPKTDSRSGGGGKPKPPKAHAHAGKAAPDPTLLPDPMAVFSGGGRGRGRGRGRGGPPSQPPPPAGAAAASGAGPSELQHLWNQLRLPEIEGSSPSGPMSQPPPTLPPMPAMPMAAPPPPASEEDRVALEAATAKLCQDLKSMMQGGAPPPPANFSTPPPPPRGGQGQGRGGGEKTSAAPPAPGANAKTAASFVPMQVSKKLAAASSRNNSPAKPQQQSKDDEGRGERTAKQKAKPQRQEAAPAAAATTTGNSDEKKGDSKPQPKKEEEQQQQPRKESGGRRLAANFGKPAPK